MLCNATLASFFSSLWNLQKKKKKIFCSSLLLLKLLLYVRSYNSFICCLRLVETGQMLSKCFWVFKTNIKKKSKDWDWKQKKLKEKQNQPARYEMYFQRPFNENIDDDKSFKGFCVFCCYSSNAFSNCW